jgi:hypothetical protein
MGGVLLAIGIVITLARYGVGTADGAPVPIHFAAIAFPILCAALGAIAEVAVAEWRVRAEIDRLAASIPEE